MHIWHHKLPLYNWYPGLKEDILTYPLTLVLLEAQVLLREDSWTRICHCKKREREVAYS